MPEDQIPYKNIKPGPGMVAYTFNASTLWEAEAGLSLWMLSQTGLYREFLASQVYTVSPCLKSNSHMH